MAEVGKPPKFLTDDVSPFTTDITPTGGVAVEKVSELSDFQIEKKKKLDEEAIAAKQKQTQEIYEKYKEYTPTQYFAAGDKNYLVMNAERGFEGLLPYEQLYILEDQGYDTRGPEFDQMREQAEAYRQGNIMLPGYSKPIPFYPTDPRYKIEYDRQVTEVADAALRNQDPIAFYTNGYVNEGAVKAIGAMLAPILTESGKAFLLSGMVARGVPTPPTQVGGAALTGLGLAGVTAGQYLSGLTQSAIGEVAAGQLYNNINNILRGDFGAVDPSLENLSEGAKKAVKEFAGAYTWTGGADALTGLARYLGPAGWAKVIGLGTEQSKNLQKTASQLGINLAPIHFASDWVKGTAKVLGVFPVLNRAFRKGGEIAQRELLNAMDSLQATYGPVFSMNNVGVNMLKQAKGQKKLAYQAVEAAYQNFENIAKNIKSPIVKGTNISGWLSNRTKILEDINRGGEASNYLKALLDIQDNPSFKPFLDSLRETLTQKGGLTILEARQLQKNLNEGMSNYIKGKPQDLTKEEVGALLQLKTAVERDINSINFKNVPESERVLAEQAQAALSNANNVFAKFATGFDDSVAAKTFANADAAYALNLGPDIYKPGRVSQQKFYKGMLNVMKEDPEAMKGFKDIVGQKEFDSAMGSWINSAYAESFAKGIDIDDVTGQVLMTEGLKSNVFNPLKFAEKLGLNTAPGRQALKEAIGEEKVKSLQKFIKLADAVDEIAVGDPSTFVGRRVTLSGIQGLAALASVGGAAGIATYSQTEGSLPATAAVTALTKILLAYGGFRFINNPKRLNQLIDWQNRNVGTKALSRKGIAEIMNLAEWAGVPTDAEDTLSYQQALAYKKAVEGEMVLGPTEGQIRKGLKKPLEAVDILEELETDTTAPGQGQESLDVSFNTTPVAPVTPGLPSSVDPVKFGMLFPGDITGQQAAMSAAQQPRIANQGGLAKLLGFKA